MGQIASRYRERKARRKRRKVLANEGDASGNRTQVQEAALQEHLVPSHSSNAAVETGVAKRSKGWGYRERKNDPKYDTTGGSSSSEPHTPQRTTIVQASATYRHDDLKVQVSGRHASRHGAPILPSITVLEAYIHVDESNFGLMQCQYVHYLAAIGKSEERVLLFPTFFDS